MGNSKYSGRYREKAAGASLCGRHMEPLPEPWAEPSAAVNGPWMNEISCRNAGRRSCRLIRHDFLPFSKVSRTGFSRNRERYRASALYCERGSFRIQVVPRTYTFALSLSDCRIPAQASCGSLPVTVSRRDSDRPGAFLCPGRMPVTSRIPDGIYPGTDARTQPPSPGHLPGRLHLAVRGCGSLSPVHP